MKLLTSIHHLRDILEYQAGAPLKELLIQPDVVCSYGHLNLFKFQDSFQPTYHAFVEVMKSKSSTELIKYLMHLGLDASFLVGDCACLNGNMEVLRFLFNTPLVRSKVSFKCLSNAAVSGNVEAFQFLLENFKLFVLPSSLLTAAVTYDKGCIIDWIVSSIVDPHNPQSIPREHFNCIIEYQHIALLYYIKQCTTMEHPAVKRVLQLLCYNPTLLIQARPLKSSKVVDICASIGNLALLQVLFAYQGEESHVALDSAASNGHLRIVKYLTGDETVAVDADPDTDTGATLAGTDSSTGSGENSVFPSSQYSIHATIKALTDAAVHNHLEVVEYLCTHRYEGYDSHIYDFVAAQGHLNVLLYLELHANDYFRDMLITTDAMDIAASSGYLDIVMHLSNTRFEGCTTDAMDNAASNGHLEVLQYLHANRAEGYTEKAFDQAAGNGHVHIMEWLLHTFQSTPDRLLITSRALDLAATNGQMSVLVWIHKNIILNTQLNKGELKPTRVAFDQAAGNGNLVMLQYLLNTYDNLLSIISVELAARNGHVLILQWLFEHFQEMFTPELAGFDYITSNAHSSPQKQKPAIAPFSFSDNAAANIAPSASNVASTSNTGSNTGTKALKRLKTMKESNFASSPLSDAFSIAIRHGKVNTVLWLHNQLHCIPTDDDMDWAARNGHFSMLLYLLHQFSDYARPSIKALEWSILNNHYDIVHYLLDLHYTHSSTAFPYFTLINSICYAKRYGQADLQLFLDAYGKSIQVNMTSPSHHQAVHSAVENGFRMQPEENPVNPPPAPVQAAAATKPADSIKKRSSCDLMDYESWINDSITT